MNKLIPLLQVTYGKLMVLDETREIKIDIIVIN